MLKNKRIFIGLINTVIMVLLFTSQTVPNNINGFFADPGSFEFLSRYQGRNNVLKVDGAKTSQSIVRYSLAQYKDKPIAIEISADVWREKNTETLYWQVNNEPNYPAVAWVDNASPRAWHNLSGKIIITPTARDPYILTGEKKMLRIYFMLLTLL